MITMEAVREAMREIETLTAAIPRSIYIRPEYWDGFMEGIKKVAVYEEPFPLPVPLLLGVPLYKSTLYPEPARVFFSNDTFVALEP